MLSHKQVVLGLLTGFAFIAPTYAADTLSMVPVSDALKSPEAQKKIDNSVQFYFGNSKYPTVSQSFGIDVSNKKTNSVGRNDHDACQRAFVSALIQMQTHAKELGANAVINIHSYFKKKDVANDTQVECYSGLLMSGVTLRGEFVKTVGK